MTQDCSLKRHRIPAHNQPLQNIGKQQTYLHVFGSLKSVTKCCKMLQICLNLFEIGIGGASVAPKVSPKLFTAKCTLTLCKQKKLLRAWCTNVRRCTQMQSLLPITNPPQIVNTVTYFVIRGYLILGNLNIEKNIFFRFRNQLDFLM